MRKTLTATLCAAFCAILCALSSLGGGGMNLGARTAAWVGGGAPTARDYVQDGLIFQFDGIENCGRLSHTSNVYGLKDLVSGRVLTANFGVAGGMSVDSDSIRINNGSVSTFLSLDNIGDIRAYDRATIEACYWCGDKVYDYSFTAQFNLFGMVVSAQGFHFPLVYTMNGTYHYSTGIYVPSYKNLTFITNGNLDNSRVECYSNSSRLYGATLYNPGSTSINKDISFGNTYPQSNHAVENIIFAVRVYNRALTAAEIAANYAVDKARFGLT